MEKKIDIPNEISKLKDKFLLRIKEENDSLKINNLLKEVSFIIEFFDENIYSIRLKLETSSVNPYNKVKNSKLSTLEKVDEVPTLEFELKDLLKYNETLGIAISNDWKLLIELLQLLLIYNTIMSSQRDLFLEKIPSISSSSLNDFIYFKKIFTQLKTELKIKLLQSQKKQGRKGGRPKPQGSLEVKKPNTFMSIDLNQNSLYFRYRLSLDPKYLEKLNDKDIVFLLNSDTFYKLSTQAAWFEDGVLALIDKNKSLKENGNFYELNSSLVNFYQLAGATGNRKKNLNEFMQKTLKGETAYRIWAVSKDKNGKVANASNFQLYIVDFPSNDKIKISFRKEIFQSIKKDKLSNNKSSKGYMKYPRTLQRKLTEAYPGRQMPNSLRAFYDYILRELENKKKSKKPSAEVMAAINNSSVFYNTGKLDKKSQPDVNKNKLMNKSSHELFSINKAKLKKFLLDAQETINKVKIRGKMIKIEEKDGYIIMEKYN